MKLSIITLTYNHLDFTKQYIESLYKYTSDFELIVVDNGSTDGTVEYLKSLDKDNLKLVFNKENLGFSKGNNQGIEISESEYIGFLNNDILLSPNWFIECEKVFERENAAFVSPRQVNPHFENINSENYLKEYKNNSSNSYEKSFDNCEFACVITKKDILSKIGGFDEKFSPAFFEDNDLKIRALDAGYDIFVVNTVPFFHYGSVTSKKLDRKLDDNKQYLFSKHRLAEYFYNSSQERDTLTKRLTVYELSWVKYFYFIYRLFERCYNRVKNTFKEK